MNSQEEHATHIVPFSQAYLLPLKNLVLHT